MKSIEATTDTSVVLMLVLAGTFVFVSSIRAQASGYYEWPDYSPTIAYDYQDEYGTIPPPTQICPDGVYDDYTGDPVSTYIDGWWCFRWGSNANPAVTEDAWIPMLQRYNEDFDYITNIMRWPRDSRARNGYYSTVYLYGSGLSTDDASNTDPGGWQGMAGGYPMVLASYIPVYAFDPASGGGDDYQTGAMIHEGIHCILSSMPGCFNSCWFHEGGNTWLQGTMEAQRSGNFSGMGWLSVGSAIAPFMPIECYSGWLQDGSFGGPCAQGVNQGSGICTWRNLLGGTQYGECFPHALEVILGPKSVAWIWRNCDESGRVLQDLAEAPGGLGGSQVRRLIQEYRARQAFCDFGQWSYAFRQLLNNNWGATIQEEYSPYWYDVDPWYATCYVDTTQNSSVLTPDDLTLPGWSGANQIPLTIDGGAAEATVTFNPIGANMSCQLVYRDTSGNIHYGVPVSSGECSIPLANVRNNVIVAVICNTDYIYYGESTRTAKYDYTLTMGTGVTGKADIYTRWYDYNPASYAITASAGDNGTISPSGNVSVTAGANRTFTFTPGAGYKVDEVILNGLPIGAINSYTFNNVRGNYSIAVTFRLIGAEEDPPTPNPATWASIPAATGPDTIMMTATTGSDANGGIEYSFEETSGNAGGSDSGWQLSPIYTDTGLSEGTPYTYRVRMRDAYGNTGAWSTLESTATQFTGEKNIALFASVDTSHVSPWETLGAVNDNYIPTNSSDDSHGAYGNWDGSSGTWNWVEYDFGVTYRINSTHVYWWADGAGIVQPTDAYIEYWNGSSWINAGSIGLALNQWNTLETSFSTSKMRIKMVSTISTGILEWQVWGEMAAPSFTTDTINEIDATEGTAYSSTLADDAIDPESGPMTFSKVDGPAWLSVAASGDLSGIPHDSNVGQNTFTVRVDAAGGTDAAQMVIQVANLYTGTQGMDDLLGFAAQWLRLDCVDTPPCDGADLDGDHDVTITDFSMLASNWYWLAIESLQLQLQFEEMAGDTTEDSSIYARTGSLVNGPVWTSGYFGGGLSFDGTDDYVEITGFKGITGGSGRTCTAWVNTTNSNAGEVISWGSNAPGQKWLVTIGNGKIYVFVHTGYVIGTAPIADSTWHHIAVVLEDDGSPNANEIRLYVDGVEDMISASGAYAIDTGAGYDVSVGKWLSDYYAGLIDEVGIYDRALTVSEIQALAAQ